jgi:UV DNA damage endonuclease
MATNFGYACICMGINEGVKTKDEITVNRGMIEKTFIKEGVKLAGEKAILNLKDCLRVLKYNVRKDIKVYRMSSDMFPWFTHYDFKELPNYNHIIKAMTDIGDFVKENNLRVGFHPGPYTVLGSENDLVCEKAVMELNKHSEMLDLMGLPATTYYSVNIHLNSTKPTLEQSALRFCANYLLLSDSAKKRITVENDDKGAQFTIQDLYEYVYKTIGIPIIADSLHHQCHNNGYSWEESFKLAVTTWGDVKPLCHHSSSKLIHEDKKANSVRDHSDYLHEPFENFGIDVDVELECKMKDIALFKYIKDYKGNND